MYKPNPIRAYRATSDRSGPNAATAHGRRKLTAKLFRKKYASISFYPISILMKKMDSTSKMTLVTSHRDFQGVNIRYEKF
jgi:hypothetical protein